MREIKFRAWDKKEKKMIFNGVEHAFICLNLPERESTEVHSGIMTPSTEEYKRFDYMQFTGLKDKNGKEIYEGDIVADSPRYSNIPCSGVTDSAEIVEMTTISGSDDMGIDCIGYPTYWERFEVIGNIYENKDLLQAGDK